MIKYTSGELAKSTGVSVRTIRYYDQQDLLHPISRVNGRRIYDEQAITILKTIALLKILGFRLVDIREILKHDDSIKFVQDKLENQLQTFQDEITAAKQSIETIKAVQPYLSHLNDLPITSIGQIGDLMQNKKDLRHTRMTVLASGLAIDILEIVALIVSLKTGQWGWFIGAIILAIIGATFLVGRLYHRTGNLCPNCGFIFKPSLVTFIFSKHTANSRKLRCPNCHETNFCLDISADIKEY